MKKRKWLIGGVLVVLVGGLVWFNLSKAGSRTAAGVPKDAPQVKVAAVERQQLVQTVVAPGNLKASGIKEIRAPFASTQVRMLVGVGDQVKAGQPVAELQSDQQRVTVANLAAQVAQSQSALAQLLEQQQLDPLTSTQQLETAKASLIQAEQGLRNADVQASQQVEQARSALLAVQSRSAALNVQVEQSRNALEQAESAYRANPLDPAARQAYDTARAAYEEALRTSTSSARQIAAELAQAQETLRMAQDRAQGDDPIAVQQARSNMESARQALEAAKLRVEQTGALSEQIRAARASLNAAQEALAVAQDKLAQAVLTAPADGTILTVALEDGQPVMENALLYQLGGLTQLTLEARVDEVDVAKVKPGQKMTVKSNAYLDERFPGTITRVSAQTAQAEPGSTSSSLHYEVEGLVDNGGNRLRGGMSVETTIETESRSSAIVVGLETLRDEEDQSYVLVVKDNKVTLRPVTLGLRTQTQVEVVTGLEEGEQIVSGPFNLVRTLKDGSFVRIEEAQEGQE